MLKARLINSILVALLLVSLALTPVATILNTTQVGRVISLLFGISILFASLVLRVLLRRGDVRTVSITLTTFFFLVFTSLTFVFGGIRNNMVTGYFLIIVLAGFLLGGRAAIAYFGISALSILAIYYGELYGITILPFEEDVGFFDVMVLLVTLTLMSILLPYVLRSIRTSFERARQAAESLRVRNLELQASQEQLEARTEELENQSAQVQRRSLQLEAAARIARDAAAIRDVDELLSLTVQLISKQFGLSNVNLYLLDEVEEYAVLQASSTETVMGDRREEKVRVGEGVVGKVAAESSAQILGHQELNGSASWKGLGSEMALPLQARDEVLGVLDLQSDQEQAFTEDDLRAFQLLGDQLALAIENVRLFEESQRALQELETLYGQMVRESWRQRAEEGAAAYRYTGVRVEPAAPEDGNGKQRERASELPELHELTAPIELRGEAIGSIVLRRDQDSAPWEPEEAALVREVSSQIGLALENARLFEETQQRAEQERLLADITAEVRSSMSFETILQTAVRELGAALGSDRAFVRLGGNPQNADK